jgi:broad specificity phosphatase PhoE
MTAKRTATPEAVSHIFERSKDVFGTVARETEDFYHTAQAWVPEHYATVAVVSSAAVGGCLLGYLAGRRSRSGDVRRLQELEAVRGGQVPEIDIAPFLKFLKLWMLYRVATKG